MKGILFSTVAGTALLVSAAASAQTVGAEQAAQAGGSNDPVGTSQGAETGQVGGTPPAAAAAPEDSAEQGGIEEIVVTAQRRAESVQRAPVTITAIGTDALAKQNVTDFEDLQALLPNTQITVAGGARIVIAVRGIRNNDFSPGAESPVAVHIDGAYIPRLTGLQGLFYDIARVESLPGPQGTLYGRNAAAGAINIITNRPVNRFEGAAEAEVGNYSLFRGFGMLNVPVTDQLSVRAAFQRFEHDGYNKAGGDIADQTSGRFSTLYENGPFTLYTSFDYTKIGGKGTVDNDPANPPYDSRSIYTEASRRLAGVDIEQIGGTVQADYDFGFATLTAQLSARRSDETSFTRGSGEISFFNFISRAKIGELRLTSNDSEPFSWVIGAFGFDEKQPSFGITGANQSNPFGAGGTCDARNNTPTIPACGNYLPQLGLRTRSYAFFGQATWTPIDPLHITGGLRYSNDKKDYTRSFLCQVGGNGTFFDTSVCQNAPLSLSVGSPFKKGKINYKAGISYDVTDTSLVYVNTATGYRAGGSFISPFNPTYGPESITAYEIGWKNQLFDRRLVLNFSAYRQNYKDYIFTYGVRGDIVPVPGVFVPFQITQADNLGSVKITGADVTAAILVTEDDLLNLGVEYLDTKIGRGALRCGPPPAVDNGPCVVAAFTDPQGKALPNTPKWRITGSFEHTFHFDNGATLVPRVLTNFESGRFLDLSQAVGTYQDSFTRTDVSVTFTSSDKKWNVGAWVQNLEDNAIFQTAGVYTATRPELYPTRRSVIYRSPRTFGIKMGAKF